MHGEDCSGRCQASFPHLAQSGNGNLWRSFAFSQHTPASLFREADMRERAMELIRVATLALLIIGGLNWGLIGLFSVDMVAALFGAGSALSRLIYILVGASALVQAMLPDNWSTARGRTLP